MNKTFLIALLLSVALCQNMRDDRGPIMGGETIKVIEKPDVNAKIEDIQKDLGAPKTEPMDERTKKAMNIAIEEFNLRFKNKQVLGELTSYSTQIVAGTKYSFVFQNKDTKVKHTIQVVIKYWYEEGHPERVQVYFD